MRRRRTAGATKEQMRIPIFSTKMPIYEICAPYYSKVTGRLVVEPELLFKMLFLGYLYGIRSDGALWKKRSTILPIAGSSDIL